MASVGDCALRSAARIPSFHRFGRKRRGTQRDSRRYQRKRLRDHIAKNSPNVARLTRSSLLRLPRAQLRRRRSRSDAPYLVISPVRERTDPPYLATGFFHLRSLDLMIRLREEIFRRELRGVNHPKRRFGAIISIEVPLPGLL
jgi:hypothetical protein